MVAIGKSTSLKVPILNVRSLYKTKFLVPAGEQFGTNPAIGEGDVPYEGFWFTKNNTMTSSSVPLFLSVYHTISGIVGGTLSLDVGFVQDGAQDTSLISKNYLLASADLSNIGDKALDTGNGVPPGVRQITMYEGQEAKPEGIPANFNPESLINLSFKITSTLTVGGVPVTSDGGEIIVDYMWLEEDCTTLSSLNLI